MLEKATKAIKDDFPLFCRTCLKIRTKDGSVEPLILNKSQLYFYERVKEQLKKSGKVRLVVVKGRQQGLSTIIEALYFWQTIFRRGINTFILTHEAEATKNLFSMARRYYEHFPLKQLLTTTEDSANSIIFDGIDSGYKVGTAGNKAVGRSQTIQLFHGSEAAFWPHAEEHAAGILQAIPNVANTYVIFESTANGIGNFFYDKYRDAIDDESDFELVFIPWYWQDEYRRPVSEDFRLHPEEVDIKNTYHLDNEQINWRRHKIKELHTTGIDGHLKFKQEYPFTVEEAFIATSLDVYLDIERVQKACQQADDIVPYGALILGVDPSGAGKDKTAFALRTGRVVHKVWSVNTKDTMHVVGLIVQELQSRPIQYCFIDTIGIGAGVYDRLKEMGHSHIVQRVNASEAATNRDLYHNLRAEMWARLKEWLDDTPCKIPDDPELLNQLVSVGYKADSKGRLLMEAKDDVKKDGRPSPDKADALTYTFAKPVHTQASQKIVYKFNPIV